MSLNDLPGEKVKLGLSPRTYLSIVQHSIHSRPYEMCGVLYHNPTNRSLFQGLSFAGIANIADDAKRSFVLDPEQQRSIKERFIIDGIVHSHPEGEARPSDYDKGSWVENGWWYLVVGMATGVPVVGCWKVVDGEFVKGKLRVI